MAQPADLARVPFRICAVQGHDRLLRIHVHLIHSDESESIVGRGDPVADRRPRGLLDNRAPRPAARSISAGTRPNTMDGATVTPGTPPTFWLVLIDPPARPDSPLLTPTQAMTAIGTGRPGTDRRASDHLQRRPAKKNGVTSV